MPIPPLSEYHTRSRTHSASSLILYFCTPSQAKIANYCRDIFGDMLLDKPIESHPIEPNVELPPPSFLKRKIIIKNKKKHHHHHHHKKAPATNSVATTNSSNTATNAGNNSSSTAATGKITYTNCTD